MTDKRINAITDWAAEAQKLSASALDLNEPAESLLKAIDLARETAQSLDLPFETEPSSFVKLLHDLAPTTDAAKESEK